MSNLEGGNQLGIGVNCAIRPNATNLHRIALFEVALFLPTNPQISSIAVNSGNPFDGTNAGTLCQCADYRYCLVRVECVCLTSSLLLPYNINTNNSSTSCGQRKELSVYHF
jgi:hypothetical protein